MKCRYNHCKFGGEVDKKDAVKVGTHYYHKECNQEKELKRQIENFYYDKYQNNEPIQAVRRAINKYINKDGFEPKYVLYTLHEDIKLNSLFGLIYYLRMDKFKNKYYRSKAKMIVSDKKIDTDNTNDFQYNPIKTKGWGDMICQR